MRKKKKIIEPIKPIISKFPKKWRFLDKNLPVAEVTEWSKYISGWDFGEDENLIGKINRIIEWINNHERSRLAK